MAPGTSIPRVDPSNTETYVSSYSRFLSALNSKHPDFVSGIIAALQQQGQGAASDEANTLAITVLEQVQAEHHGLSRTLEDFAGLETESKSVSLGELLGAGLGAYRWGQTSLSTPVEVSEGFDLSIVPEMPEDGFGTYVSALSTWIQNFRASAPDLFNGTLESLQSEVKLTNSVIQAMKDARMGDLDNLEASAYDVCEAQSQGTSTREGLRELMLRHIEAAGGTQGVMDGSQAAVAQAEIGRGSG